MITLLSKLFIKNSKNYTSPDVRSAYGVLCGAVGITLNLILFSFKFFAGTVTKSIAITADAFNNLSDAGSSIITLIGFRIARKRPDPDHPYGHGRMEYIAGLLVSVAILIMSFELIKSSADKIIHPTEITSNWLSITILIFSICVKIYMACYNRFISKRINSTAMKATATDSFSDTCATFVVLICTLISVFFHINIDGYCGVVVGLFIGYAGICAIRDTIAPLLGQRPEPEFVKKIETIVMSHESILGMHDLIVHDYGPGRVMVSLHAEVPAKGNILELHDLIDNIEKDLRNELSCDATIHMDPIQNDDADTIELKSYVNSLLHSLDDSISLHDFRIVTGPTHTNLIFDVLTPYNYKMSDYDICEFIQSEVQKKYPNHFCVIEVDKDYCDNDKSK